MTAARYVCRAHPDCSVTWRGTGCPECARESANVGRFEAAIREDRAARQRMQPRRRP